MNPLGSALARRSRFLRHDRFDNRLLTEQLRRRLDRRPDPRLWAPDWTQWPNRCPVLTAAVCTGTRAVPVAVSAGHKPQLGALAATSGKRPSGGSSWLGCERPASVPSGAATAASTGSRGSRRLLELEPHFVVRVPRDVTMPLGGAGLRKR